MRCKFLLRHGYLLGDRLLYSISLCYSEGRTEERRMTLDSLGVYLERKMVYKWK